MPKLQDFVTDQNPVPLHLAAAADIEPDYVKKARMLSADDVAGLHPSMFADPVLRLLPVITKEATWMSAAYFHGSKEWQDMPDVVRESVKAGITKAADHHGITADVLEVAEVMNRILADEEQEDLQKAASASTSDYALLVEFNGGTKAYYPIYDGFNIVKSARSVVEDFHENRIPLDWYVHACREITKAASDQGVSPSELPDRVLAAGEPRVPDFDAAMDIAAMRKSAGVPEEMISVYQDVVRQAGAAYNDGDRDMDKWASLWLDLDRMHKVAYDNFTLDPYQAFFSGARVKDIEKAASEMVLVGEALVPRQVIASMEDRMIDSMFRKSTAAIIKEARKSAADGPGPDASQILSELSNDDVTVLLRGLVSKHSRD